jgi:hypothetical protein
MSKAVSFLKQIAGDRATLDSFTETLSMEVVNGEIDPIWLHGTLTKFIKNLQALKELNENELSLEDAKHEAFGYKFAKKEAGTKYDFSNCNHPRLTDLSVKEKEINKEKKDIEALLKVLKNPTTIVDEETGDIVTINPPIKSSKTIIEVR